MVPADRDWVGAIWTGSLALLVDSAHVLTDAAGLLMALIAAVLADRPAMNRHLGPAPGRRCSPRASKPSPSWESEPFVITEAIQRLVDPPEINAPGLLVLGVLGLVGNLAAIGVLALSAVAESPRWPSLRVVLLIRPGVRDGVTLVV